MFKEAFYAALRNDFSAHTTESFLYQYFKKEKEDNLRLKLKQNDMDRKDTVEDRAEYTKILIECLLENSRLQKLYQELGVVFTCLGIDPEAEGSKKNNTEKIKTGLKNLMTEMQNNQKDRVPGLAELHIATGEILQRTNHSDQRKDVYVQLKETWMDYRMGKLSQGEYLCELIAFLGNNPKLRLAGENGRAILELGKKLGGEKIYEKLRKEQEKYQKTAEIIRESQALTDQNDLLEDREVTRMTEEILDAILKIDVRTFLYDIGYSEKTADGVMGESRKKDRTMDMLDKYCKEHNISFISGMACANSGIEKINDPKYIKECKRLFEQLNRDKITKVFVPLVIDPVSGAGIYIIGREYYKEFPDKQKEIRTSCCYRYLTLEDIVINAMQGSETQDDVMVNLVMRETKMDETLESVVKIFQNYIVSQGALEGYQSNNEKVPSDCSASFQIYFNPEEWECELQSDMQNYHDIFAKEKAEEEKYSVIISHHNEKQRRRTGA